jgi:hypothetical protein
LCLFWKDIATALPNAIELLIKLGNVASALQIFQTRQIARAITPVFFVQEGDGLEVGEGRPLGLV